MKNLKTNIGIINCDFGNIASLINAIKHLQFNYEVLKKPSDLKLISHLILPGVGSFNESAKRIRETGWSKAIIDHTSNNKPFLGICLGMQLMFETGSENGEEMGIGLFKGRCEKFSDKIEIKLPHIGFNLVNHPNSRIWRDIPNNSPFYFVHSYRIIDDKKNYENGKNISNTYYGESFISFVENKNTFGAQFHPEKSHKTGLKLIKNFGEIHNL